MTKYRFKTQEEFKESGDWMQQTLSYYGPSNWNEMGEMDKYYGQDIPDAFIKQIESEKDFNYDDWTFRACECILNSTELSEEETKQILEQIKNNNSLVTKTMKNTETKSVKRNPVGDKFVFMDKTVNILNVGFSTSKNVILYGPGE